MPSTKLICNSGTNFKLCKECKISDDGEDFEIYEKNHKLYLNCKE